jgi:hypothetical protein
MAQLDKMVDQRAIAAARLGEMCHGWQVRR